MIAIAVFTAAVASCTDDEEIVGTLDRGGYFLNRRSLSLIKGTTGNLYATKAPKSDPATVSWTSEDPSVASVSDDGLVTALHSGETVIQAKIGDVILKCNVDVTSPVTSVVLSNHDVELDKGDSFQLSYEIGPDDINVPIEVIWSSSDDNILTVSSDGLVNTHLGGRGMAVIKVNDVTDVCNFFIHCYPTGVQIPEDDASIKVGETAQFTYEILPADNTEELDIAWSVDNEEIASVDQTGLVTGLHPGVVTVTVTAGEFTAQKTVTISAATVVLRPLSAEPTTEGLATIEFTGRAYYYNGTYGMYIYRNEPFTVSVPEGYKITRIEMNQTSTYRAPNVNTGSITRSGQVSVWTPSSTSPNVSSVTFTPSNTTRANTWTVTYE